MTMEPPKFARQSDARATRNSGGTMILARLTRSVISPSNMELPMAKTIETWRLQGEIHLEIICFIWSYTIDGKIHYINGSMGHVPLWWRQGKAAHRSNMRCHGGYSHQSLDKHRGLIGILGQELHVVCATYCHFGQQFVSDWGRDITEWEWLRQWILDS